MFCSKCGAQIEDNSVFCSECGGKCQETNTQQTATNSNSPLPSANVQPAQQSASMHSNYPQGNNQGANYSQQNQTTVTSTAENIPEPAAQPINNTPDEPIILQPKKKKKFLKVLIPILAVIVILSVTVIAFGRTIFFAVAPEAYVSSLIKATTDDIQEELNQIEKNVFGFDVSMNNKMTAGTTVSFDDGNENVDLDIKLANNPKEKKLLLDGQATVNGQNLDAHGYLDNENMGLMLPGSDGKYLSLPSKDLGKELSKSDGLLGESYDDASENDEMFNVFSTLDLSYSTIKQFVSPDKKFARKTTKHVSSNLIDFMKEADISGRESVQYKFEDKTVNAHEITLNVEAEDIVDLCINIVEDINNDEKIEKVANIEEIIEKLKDSKDELTKSDSNIPDFEIKLIEYKGKIVSVEIIIEMSEGKRNAEVSATISTTNRDKMLNGIVIDISGKDSENGEVFAAETEFTANWASKLKKKDVIEMRADISIKEGETPIKMSVDFEMDFNKEEWEISLKPNSTGTSISYSGKCSRSKKDGFSISLKEDMKTTDYEYEEYNTITFDEWIDEEYDSYRDSYLRYVYEDQYSASYDYYSDWYESSSREIWDDADTDFKEWLYEEQYSSWYDSLEDAYESDTGSSRETPIEKEMHINVEFTLKNSVDVEEKSGKNENILDWDEADFDNFESEFQNEIGEK